MGWLFTRNHLPDSNRLHGQARDGTEDIPFKLYDDDGNLYFEGLISASWLNGEAELAFAPLDFAEAKYGCTSMMYYEDDAWRIL